MGRSALMQFMLVALGERRHRMGVHNLNFLLFNSPFFNCKVKLQ